MGTYVVDVIAKQLVSSLSQKYSIAITSGGYVEEQKTHTAVKLSELMWETGHDECVKNSQVYIRLQLEDWKSGVSWQGIHLDIIGPSGTLVYNCTFGSNTRRHVASFSMTKQCSVCLPDDATYSMSINPQPLTTTSTSPELLRVSSPDCQVYLSQWMPSSTLTLQNGICNNCTYGNTPLEIVMLANVTDDDVQDYSW